MSKSKIQFNHNIKKIKQQRELKRLLQQERQSEQLSYITSSFGKLNSY